MIMFVLPIFSKKQINRQIRYIHIKHQIRSYCSSDVCSFVTRNQIDVCRWRQRNEPHFGEFVWYDCQTYEIDGHIDKFVFEQTASLFFIGFEHYDIINDITLIDFEESANTARKRLNDGKDCVNAELVAYEQIDNHESHENLHLWCGGHFEQFLHMTDDIRFIWALSFWVIICEGFQFRGSNRMVLESTTDCEAELRRCLLIVSTLASMLRFYFE